MTKGIVEPFIEVADVYALRALADGVASADQQKRAGNWLLTEACRLMADPYVEVRDAGSVDTADVTFALGRRHVGKLIRDMLLPQTLEKAKRNTAAAHPEATTTTPRKPSLGERQRNARGK